MIGWHNPLRGLFKQRSNGFFEESLRQMSAEQRWRFFILFVHRLAEELEQVHQGRKERGSARKAAGRQAG